MNEKPLVSRLTGNYYFKPTVLGMVAMVERTDTYSDNVVVTKFKVATTSDLFELNLLSTPSNTIKA